MFEGYGVAAWVEIDGSLRSRHCFSQASYDTTSVRQSSRIEFRDYRLLSKLVQEMSKDMDI